MDRDWGNILPFILMALFAIFGAINKKKKPVNRTQANTDIESEDEMPSSVENIFDSLLGRDAFEGHQVHPYQVMQEEFVEEEIVDLPRKEIKIEPVKYSSPIVMEVDEAEDGDNIEIDWKQAIISKEILDRKYI